MAKAKTTEAQIVQFNTGRVTLGIMGTSPLIMNKMSEKAWQELLSPAPKKNKADKALSLKHNPLDEYRGSMYRMRDSKADSLLGIPAVSFKRSMSSAALDVSGMKKTEVGRLSWCIGTEICVFGLPQMLMSIVKSAGQNKTPDVRTRAILPEWGCVITMSYVQPNLNDTMIVALMAAAGMVVGVGDWRQEKGSGNYGQFQLVDPNSDKQFKRLVGSCGRKPQIAAYNDPDFYDEESKALYEWWVQDTKRRGRGSEPMRQAAL